MRQVREILRMKHEADCRCGRSSAARGSSADGS